MKTFHNRFVAMNDPFLECSLDCNVFEMLKRFIALKSIEKWIKAFSTLVVKQIPNTIFNSPFLILLLLYLAKKIEKIIRRTHQLGSRCCHISSHLEKT